MLRKVIPLWHNLAPSNLQTRAMLIVLKHHIGALALADGLGTSKEMVYQWINAIREPGDSTRKLVWLVYSLVFKPENLATWFDLVTWGRYARDPGTRPAGWVDPYAKQRRMGRRRKKDKKGKFISKAVKYQAFDAGI